MRFRNWVQDEAQGTIYTTATAEPVSFSTGIQEWWFSIKPQNLPKKALLIAFHRVSPWEDTSWTYSRRQMTIRCTDQRQKYIQHVCRPLSFPGWTTAMLFWLDFHQTQSNLYKWFRMQRHDWSSTSPNEPMLHLSLSPCTGDQLQLASSSRHWCLYIEQPQAQHPPTSTHYYEFTSPPEVWDLLVSDASWYHHREAKNHSPEHSLSPFLAGGMIFPTPSRMLDPCQSSSNNWKLISFNTTWLQKKKKNVFHFFKIFIFLFIFLSVPC